MASSSSSSSNYYEPSDLRLGCPIFLSHSGSDKDFVIFLEQALCNRGYRVFFDKEILPKAVPVSMANILEEAKNQCCKLGLLVLSDDFFEKTRNPMLELATFVEHNVDLLPLFYKLSVDEFKDESRRERWYEKWRTWVPEDVITKWKAALRTVGTVSGIEFCKEAPNRKMYIDIIVDKVCEILPIDLSHISEPFQGRERLCKLWNLLREAIRLSSKPVFLAIDNVVAEESIDEAEEYLKCGPFPRGSKIFITARNLRVLQRVTKHEKLCVQAEMPALEFYEARNLFFQKMGYCTTGLHEERDSRVNECVRLCTLNKGKDDFHPLMLISLAAYLAKKVELYSDPLMWKGVVAELSSDRCSALKRVFEVLDLIYRDLSQDEKTIFIDLALYIRHLIDGNSPMLNCKPSIEIWLNGLYNKHASTSYKVETILRELETSSLIQITHHGFYMHDLVKDFAKSKVEKESNSLACLFLEKCEVNDTLGLEENKRCTRIAITKCAFKHAGTSTLDLSKLDRLEVLHLVHNQGIDKVILSQEVFQRKLYSLIVRCEPSTFIRDSTSPMIISILEETAECKQEESMKRLSLTDLKNCIIEKEKRKRSWMMRLVFLWSPHESIACMALRRLVFLRMTNVQGVVLDNLGEFPLLEELSLDGVAVNRGSINCPRLKKLHLENLTGVKTISGLEKSPSLQDIRISSCKKLESLISIPDTFLLLIMHCPDLQRIVFCLRRGRAARYLACPAKKE